MSNQPDASLRYGIHLTGEVVSQLFGEDGPADKEAFRKETLKPLGLDLGYIYNYDQQWETGLTLHVIESETIAYEGGPRILDRTAFMIDPIWDQMLLAAVAKAGLDPQIKPAWMLVAEYS